MERMEQPGRDAGRDGGDPWARPDRGDGFPVEPGRRDQGSEAPRDRDASAPGSLDASTPSPRPRSAALASEVASFRLEQLVRGPLVIIARDALPVNDIGLERRIERSIDERRTARRDLHHAVCCGQVFHCAVTRGGETVEKVAGRNGFTPLRVIRDIWLFHADRRGVLCHVGCGADGGVVEPFTLTQAEIAAGIRDFDGEYAGVFAPPAE